MDSITATLDATRLISLIPVLDAAMEQAVDEASKETAYAIAREADARLRRQLGPNATGKTAAGIEVRKARGAGYIVLSGRDPFPNLPLWIEKGTKKGKPGSHSEPARPYFYPSVLLETQAHRRRIDEALSHAITATGLGD